MTDKRLFRGLPEPRQQDDLTPVRLTSGRSFYERAVARDEIMVSALNRIAAIRNQDIWSEGDAEEAAGIASEALEAVERVP